MQVTAATVTDGITRLQAIGVALPRDMLWRTTTYPRLTLSLLDTPFVFLADATAELFAARIVWWLMTEGRVVDLNTNALVGGCGALVVDSDGHCARAYGPDPFSACVAALEQAKKASAK